MYNFRNISGNGSTSAMQWNSVTNRYNCSITISNNLVANGTKLAIVKTVLHESIHAYLKYIARQYPIVFTDPNGSFSTLLAAYQIHNNLNYAQHTYMANIITNIAANISNFVQEKYSYPVATSAYYEAVSWSGIAVISDPSNPGNQIEHPLFITNFPNTSDRDNIIKIFQTENGIVIPGYSKLVNNNCN